MKGSIKMDMSFFEGFCLPLVTAFCLILGFILKKWIRDKNDKYIPTALAVIGAVLGCVAMNRISLESICCGAFSGLASTGLHQAFKQIINERK